MLPQEPLQAGAPPTTFLKASYPSDIAPSAQPTAFTQGTLHHDAVRISRYNSNLGSTAKGIMIGIFSVLGAAGVCLIIAAIVYYFRYTNQGRIFLDRITRPGEYDDEQQFAKEEAEALEDMDDIQRAEYMRAKGMANTAPQSMAFLLEHPLTLCSFCASEPTRIRPDRHLVVAVPGHTREGCVSMGIRARTRDCQLLCRRPNRNRVLRLRMQRPE
jgi:hypothetical protein